MADNMMQSFKVMLVVMLFYSMAITMLTYAIPEGARNYVTVFSDSTSDITLEGVGAEVQDSLTRQTNMPIIEAGALVFYSGNILIDLLLNFAYAIPQMLGMLIHGITILFNLDTTIFMIVQLFASVLITILYLLGLIQLLTGIRSGRSIA